MSNENTMLLKYTSLVEVREYEIPTMNDKDEWVVECRMFLNFKENLYYPRVYRRIEMKMQPSDERFIDHLYDEITLTDEPFLWDAGDKIRAENINHAFEVMEAKFMHRLGHRSNGIDINLKFIIS
jgi:hypothetical protein